MTRPPAAGMEEESEANAPQRDRRPLHAMSFGASGGEESPNSRGQCAG